MTSTQSKKVPWYLWPFWAIWWFVAWIVELTGRVVAVVLGAAFVIVGFIVSFTVILLPLGIPLIILGFLLVIRGLF